MSNKNKHGLPRHIPKAIKQAVRQRCGFGCVRCGFAFFDYEHFDPDFAEAKEHNANGITLLCSQCNQKRARGRLSAETVSRANANPVCLQKGFTAEMFDFSPKEIEVELGGVVFKNCNHLVVINDTPILSISRPESPGLPLLLSGFFLDQNGKLAIAIEDNAWRVSSKVWDVEITGPRIYIKTAEENTTLEIHLSPPKKITIKNLRMVFQKVIIEANDKTVKFSMNDGKDWATFHSVSMTNCHTGIAINPAPQLPQSPANDAIAIPPW